MSPSSPNVNSSIYKTIARPVLFFVGLLFFISLVVQSWNEVQNILQTLIWPLFLVSVCIALLDNVLLSFLFKDLIAKYNFQIDYPHVGQMYFYGQMAKYIPGQLWSVLFHATFLKRRDATSAMLFANLDLMGVSIIRGGTIALALILFYHQAHLAVIVFLVGSLAFWYFSKSCWIVRVFHFVTRHFESLSDNISACTMCKNNRNILLINASIWITYMVANFLFMKASFNLSVEEAAPYIAYFALAWIVGTVSFFVPAGIGVREIAFVYLVNTMGGRQGTSIESLTAVAVVYRFWLTLMELGGLGFGFVLSHIKKDDL